jgi:tetratricopeptide (TPR) repeat protein
MIYLLVLIILFSYSPMAFADLVDDRDLLLEQGLKFFGKQKYKDAIVSFDAILEFEPDDVDALFNKAKALVQIDNSDEGMSYMKKALEIEPDNVDVMAYLSAELVKSGRLEEAKIHYEKILEINPDNVDALGFKGDELARSGNSKDGLAYFKKILEIEQYKVDTSKIPYFDKVLEIEPDNVDALNAKGSSMVMLGRSNVGNTIIFIDNLDESITYFDRVLEIEPDNVDALFNKGRALVQLDKSDEGMPYVEKILEIEPDNVDVLTYKADELLRDGKYEEGAPYLERVLESEPDNVDALFLKGLVLTEQGSFHEALSHYDQVMQINPEHVVAKENLKFVVRAIGYKNLDGFLDVKIHDLQDKLVGHLRIVNLKILNHTIGKNLIEEWPVTKVITRNGQDYEVLQYEKSKSVKVNIYSGGASHYGIKYPYAEETWKMYANYWQYRIHEGDTVTFVYTVFRPLA